MICPDIQLRRMGPEDIAAIAHAFQQQGWTKPEDVLAAYLTEQDAGNRHVVVAVLDRQITGYGTLLPQDREGPFAGQPVPAICDLNVFLPFRRRGIAQAILAELEAIASGMSDRISLAVGLHSGYGFAQRLYARNGYCPDGSGAWYQGRNLPAYAPCHNDDSLLLYLVKDLT